MNEPSTDEAESAQKRPADPPKPAPRPKWPRTAIIVLIGAPILLAGLTVIGFGLFTRSVPGDPDRRDFKSESAGSGGAYYRIRVDYLPRYAGSVARQQGVARKFGASVFDEGLRTTIAVDVARGRAPVERLALWRGDGKADAQGRFTAFQKQDPVTVAVTLTPTARPRLRWNIDLPSWATGILADRVPRARADPPPAVRIAPPAAAGQPPAATTIVVRDYKGTAIGDLHVTPQWRPSVLFDAAFVRAGPAPNRAIESFLAANADAAARKSAVLEMIALTDADFAGISAIKSWIAERFAAAPGDTAQCAKTYDAALGRFALSAGDAALLTYFVHREGAGFTAATCGRDSLGAALRRIGAPPAVKQAPPATAGPVQSPAPKALPAPRLGASQILQRLAREWKAGLARNGRTDSTRFIRADARLTQPNRFNLFQTTPFTDRAAILDDHAANRVRHFACFVARAQNSMAAIVERQQGATTAVFRYRFFFGADNKIGKIHRRPAIQADINDLKRTLRGTACVDRFLASEEARLRRLIGGGGLAAPPPAVAPAALVTIESNRIWKNPPPRGRARNRVTVDLDVLDAIPKSTLPRDGG